MRDHPTREQESRARIRQRLKEAIETATDDINANGIAAIMGSGLYISSARIIITINEDMFPTVTYETTMIPIRGTRRQR